MESTNGVVVSYVGEDGSVMMQLEHSNGDLLNPNTENRASNLGSELTPPVGVKTEPEILKSATSLTQVWEDTNDGLFSATSGESVKTPPCDDVVVTDPVTNMDTLANSATSLTLPGKYVFPDNHQGTLGNLPTHGTQIDTSSSDLTSVTPMNFPGNGDILENSHPLGYDELNAEIDLNQVEYIQSDYKVEKEEYMPDDEFQESYNVDVENSAEFGVKTENVDNTDGENSAEFYIKTESLANTVETFFDIFQPSKAQAEDSDSDSSSCPSVLEEFSNFPERTPPPTPEIQQIPENVPLESETVFPMNSASDSDSEDDIVCLKSKNLSEMANLSEMENLSETENSSKRKRGERSVMSSDDAEEHVEMQAVQKQLRAEHMLRGTTKVLSCTEVNDIKCRVPKNQKLTEILTITELSLAGGVKRFKIFYERNTAAKTSKDDHSTYIMKCNNIVKQIRSVHNVLKVGEKAGEVFSGMILVEPRKPSLESPFQMLYIWRPDTAGSILHILDIKGLNFVIRPFRLGPFLHTHKDGENHQCALLFSESQVAKSQLSSSIKHALLQIVSNQWKAEGKEKCHPVLRKNPPQKRKQRGQKRIKITPVKPPQLVMNTLLNRSAQGKSVKEVPVQKSSDQALKDLLKKKVGLNQPKMNTLGIVSPFFLSQDNDDDVEFVSTGTTVLRESPAEVIFPNGRGGHVRSSVCSAGSSNIAVATLRTITENLKNVASIASVIRGPEAERLFSNSNSTPSEPRAEIEFTNTKSVADEPRAEVQFTRVKSEPVVPRAELEFTNIKKEPGMEIGLDCANSTNDHRAEIEFSLVKSEPADTGQENGDSGEDDFDDEPIAPLSEEQINIIMNQTRLDVGKSPIAANTNVATETMEVTEKNVPAIDASSQLSASTIIKATNLLNSKTVSKTANSSQPRSTRHVPNILKSSYSGESEALEGNVPDKPSNAISFSPVGVNIPMVVRGYDKKSLRGTSNAHSVGRLSKRGSRSLYMKTMQRSADKGDEFLALWNKMTENVTTSSSGVEEVVVSETDSEKSEQSGPKMMEDHPECQQSEGPKSFQSRFKRRMAKSGPMGFATAQPWPMNSWTHRLAQLHTVKKPRQKTQTHSSNCLTNGLAQSDKQAGLKILEVHSENLSAYSGDALWDRIVEKTQRSTTCSSNMGPGSKMGPGLEEGSARCNSASAETTTPCSSGPVPAVLWKRNAARDQWDKVVGKKSSNLSSSDSKGQTQLGGSKSSLKTDPADAEVSAIHSDSDSDHEGVLLRADGVAADDGDNDMDAGNVCNQSNPSDKNLNASFGRFANAQPITLHIPLPPKKKFFKSSRNTKAKFDKGKFISSMIQKDASKYQAEFIEPPRQPESKGPTTSQPVIRYIGSYTLPQEPAVKPRKYSCSLPHGGEVIRRVGIIKEIKSASAPSPYSCSVCGHSFKYSGHLRKHVKIHTEFRCDICKCDMPTRKIYDCHINTFHTFLSDRSKLDPPKQDVNPKYDNLERYFSYVEGENEDKSQDLDWEKCYRENGIGGSKTDNREVVDIPDDNSIHSSDSDVQDGDVFAPLANVMSGPSEDEWAKIISK
ncbi:uncharacterized protein LOC135499003 [Lineus longissimus]|uniref:uncharacterized protein LOC135499003 n=1 Tax=Lineus longissimus TaxID=88925 RepID=UPI00315DAD11